MNNGHKHNPARYIPSLQGQSIGVCGVNEAELLMPTCTEYIQSLYKQSDFHGSKYLGIELRDENILHDVKRLIEIRSKTK